MEDWKVRLKEETLVLAAKLNRLGDYMRTEKFPTLNRVDKDLLYDQYHAMLTYLQILGKRCELHKIALNDSYSFSEETEK